jgi:hypothetical protein
MGEMTLRPLAPVEDPWILPLGQATLRKMLIAVTFPGRLCRLKSTSTDLLRDGSRILTTGQLLGKGKVDGTDTTDTSLITTTGSTHSHLALDPHLGVPTHDTSTCGNFNNIC